MRHARQEEEDEEEWRGNMEFRSGGCTAPGETGRFEDVAERQASGHMGCEGHLQGILSGVVSEERITVMNRKQRGS